MASPFIVVVVVAVSDPHDAANRAMARAVQDVLADTALVVVREEARPDDEAQLTRVGDDMHANAVIVVRWPDDSHAEVRVYRTAVKGWTSRDVAFGGDDSANERGRTLGFGVASMVRASEPPVEEPRRVDMTPPPPPPPPPPLRPTRPRWDLEVAGQAALGASTTSFGAAFGAGFRVVDRLQLRADIGGRAGSLEAAHASTLYLRAAAGASWAYAWGRFTFGPRLELGTIRQQASRNDVSSSGGRWSALVDARVEGTAPIASRFAVVFGVGTEVALERVPIRVDGVRVTTLAPVRALGTVGVRLFLDP